MNTKNTRLIVAGVMTSVALMAPFAASALSIEDLQQQIKDLLSRVASLQLQLKQQTTASTSVTGETMSTYKAPRICALMKRNLAPGISGDDVRGLQEFLHDEGFLKASATGYLVC